MSVLLAAPLNSLLSWTLHIFLRHVYPRTLPQAPATPCTWDAYTVLGCFFSFQMHHEAPSEQGL